MIELQGSFFTLEIAVCPPPKDKSTYSISLRSGGPMDRICSVVMEMVHLYNNITGGVTGGMGSHDRHCPSPKKESKLYLLMRATICSEFAVNLSLGL